MWSLPFSTSSSLSVRHSYTVVINISVYRLLNSAYLEKFYCVELSTSSKLSKQMSQCWKYKCTPINFIMYVLTIAVELIGNYILLHVQHFYEQFLSLLSFPLFSTFLAHFSAVCRKIREILWNPGIFPKSGIFSEIREFFRNPGIFPLGKPLHGTVFVLIGWKRFSGAREFSTCGMGLSNKCWSF